MAGLIFVVALILIIIWITVGQKAEQDYQRQMRQKNHEKAKRAEARKKAEAERLKQIKESQFHDQGIEDIPDYNALKEKNAKLKKENKKLQEQIDDLLDALSHSEIRIEKLIQRLDDNNLL